MDFLSRILGINYRTTILGVGVIVAAAGRVFLAFRTKQYDFSALADDGQLIVETVTLLLAGFGLTKAKDQNVTGTGVTAKAVNDEGVVTDSEGKVVGQQTPKA